MDRRFLASLALVLACIAPACARPASPKRPNVLIVVTDDERHGSAAATPMLRNWFEQGTVFERAYVTTPHCCPSRASIFTGQYAHNHRVSHQNRVKLLDHSHTIQHQLHEAGYRTGFVGKFLNGWPSGKPPPSFDHWGLGSGYTDAEFVVDRTGRIVDYGPRFVFDQGRELVAKWEADDDEPWLLMLSPSAPHAPFLPEPRYADESFPWEGSPATREDDRSDKPPYVRHDDYSEAFGAKKRRSQFQTLKTIDGAFMQTVKFLERKGELDDTLVIYTSDNGYLWAEHGLVDKGVPYEGSYHVPLYLRGPGVTQGTNSEIVANIDIAPTVYEVAGIEPSYVLDGRPLLSAKRQMLLLEFAGGASIPAWTSLVSKDWQYTVYDDGFREFYDLADDPYQLSNDPGAAEPGLATRLEQARTCKGTTNCP